MVRPFSLGLLLLVFGLVWVDELAAKSADVNDDSESALACPSPDTTPGRGGHIPVIGDPAPPSADVKEVVLDAIGAMTAGKSVERFVSAEWLSQAGNESCIAAIKKLSVSCRAESPVSLTDYKVRVSWDCGGRSPYSTFFIVDGHQIIYILGERTMTPIVIHEAPAY